MGTFYVKITIDVIIPTPITLCWYQYESTIDFFTYTMQPNCVFPIWFIVHTTQMLHGAGIFTIHLPQKWPSFVGKYSSTMDPMGYYATMEYPFSWFNPLRLHRRSP